MALHIAKVEGLFMQWASMKLVMEEPLKRALLMVTLPEHKDYTAVVTSVKT